MNFLRLCILWGIGFPMMLILGLCLLVFSTIPDSHRP